MRELNLAPWILLVAISMIAGLIGGIFAAAWAAAIWMLLIGIVAAFFSGEPK